MMRSALVLAAILFHFALGVEQVHAQSGVMPQNSVWAGPTSGGQGFGKPRSLVGPDLPVPSASTLGGIESLTCATHQWLSTISIAGVPACSQPSFADLSGTPTTLAGYGITSPLPIAQGGTTANNQTNAFNNLAPSPTRAGDVTYWNGSNYVNLAGNNSGTQLFSESPSGVPSWTPTSAMVLLNTLTASNSATLSDTTSFTATYSSYDIVFENIVPVTNAEVFQVLVHSGGSFQATGYLNTGTATTTFIDTIRSVAVDNTAGKGLNGTVRVSNVSSTTTYKMVTGFVSAFSGGGMQMTYNSGLWNTSAAAIDGFEFLFAAGNISTGVIKVYGIQ
jgi:hypothetical protein